ncbi:hypothetical protein BSKO_03673 [Bryopsis sp. KO-2023]|nr:hypothetical protein BSKO_03673 [Bryopsis sp. KO-2023]
MLGHPGRTVPLVAVGVLSVGWAISTGVGVLRRRRKLHVQRLESQARESCSGKREAEAGEDSEEELEIGEVQISTRGGVALGDVQRASAGQEERRSFGVEGSSDSFGSKSLAETPNNDACSTKGVEQEIDKGLQRVRAGPQGGELVRGDPQSAIERVQHRTEVKTNTSPLSTRASCSQEDVGSDGDTPLASELGSLDSLPPEEAVAKLEAQNQVLWAKVRASSKVQKENVELCAELDSARDELAIARTDAEDQIRRLEESGDALKGRLRELAKEAEDNAAVKKENSELLAEVEDLKFQVLMAKSSTSSDNEQKNYEDVVNELRKSNKKLVIQVKQAQSNEERLNKEVDELRSALKESQNKAGPSGSDSVISDLQWKLEEYKAQSEECEILESENIRLRAKLEDLEKNAETLKTQCSKAEALTERLKPKVDDLENEISCLESRLADLEQENDGLSRAKNTLAEELATCQRQCTESEEGRSYLTSVVEDLEKQLDACSPEQVVELRSLMRRMESDNSRLESDLEILSMQLRSREQGGGSMSYDMNSTIPEACEGVSYEGSVFSEQHDLGHTLHEERSEQLVDLSEDIMTEMANVANVGDSLNLGISMSYVQYAGLLAAVQKAMKQLEEARLSSVTSPDAFTLLDQTLSRSLSITRGKAQAVDGAVEKRLNEIDRILKEKGSEISFMSDVLTRLREQLQNRKVLSLQQEVQLEYLQQQLAAPDKVIKLSWEVEGLRKSFGESEKELEALREQSDQQQQELTIQWETKQQALAESQVHHHEVSSVAQQVDHLQQANDELETEKAEMEQELAECREELETLRKEMEAIDPGRSVRVGANDMEEEVVSGEEEEEEEDEEDEEEEEEEDSVNQANDGVVVEGGVPGNVVQEQLKDILTRLQDVNCSMDGAKAWAEQIVLEKNQLKSAAEEVEEETYDMSDKAEAMLSIRDDLEAEIQGLQADVRLSESIKEKLENAVRNVQAKLKATAGSAALAEEQYCADIRELQQRLADLQSAADCEVGTLKGTKEFLEAENERLESHALDLSVQLEKTEESVSDVKSQLNSEQRSHQATKQEVVSVNQILAQERRIAKDSLANAEREIGILKGEVDGAFEKLEAQRENLSNEVQGWKAKASELEAVLDQREKLREEVKDLSKRLSSKEVALDSECKKSSTLSLTRDKLQQEVSSIQLVVHRLEDRVTSSEAEVSRLNELLESERGRYSAAARSWEEELDGIAEMTVPRSSWPVSVRKLVEYCEQAAADKVESEQRAVQIELEQEVEDATDRLEVIEAQGEKDLKKIETEKAAIMRRVTQLEGEMRERECKLQEKISHLEELSMSEKGRLESQVLDLRQRLEDAEESAKEMQSELTAKVEEKAGQLVALQEKARSMMMEKDEEIQRLKAPARISLSGENCRTASMSSELNLPTPQLMAITARDLPSSIVPAHSFESNPGHDAAVPSGSPTSVGGPGSANEEANKELLAELQAERERVFKFQQELEDNERTHALRDKANNILKAEIAELRRQSSRGNVDVAYLKNVLVSAFEKGTLPKDSPMVEVLARLLHFGPEDMEKIKKGGPGSHTRTSSFTLFQGWGR